MDVLDYSDRSHVHFLRSERLVNPTLPKIRTPKADPQCLSTTHRPPRIRIPLELVPVVAKRTLEAAIDRHRIVVRSATPTLNLQRQFQGRKRGSKFPAARSARKKPPEFFPSPVRRDSFFAALSAIGQGKNARLLSPEMRFPGFAPQNVAKLANMAKFPRHSTKNQNHDRIRCLGGVGPTNQGIHQPGG